MSVYLKIKLKKACTGQQINDALVQIAGHRLVRHYKRALGSSEYQLGVRGKDSQAGDMEVQPDGYVSVHFALEGRYKYIQIVSRSWIDPAPTPGMMTTEAYLVEPTEEEVQKEAEKLKKALEAILN